MHNEGIRRTLKDWRLHVYSETQSEFARRLGVSQATVGSWERAKTRKVPSLRTRRRIAEIFGVRVDQIIWPDEEQEVKSNAAKAA